MAYTVIAKGKRACIICGDTMPLVEFPAFAYTTKQGKRSTRYSSRCKACEAARRRDRHARQQDKSRAQSREWRERNREYALAKSAEYRGSERGRKARARCQRDRNQRQRVAEGFYTEADIQRFRLLQRGRCAYCKTSMGEKYTIDHIEPVAKGGTNWPSNLQLLCRPCNSRKQDKDPIEWANQIGMLC